MDFSSSPAADTPMPASTLLLTGCLRLLWGERDEQELAGLIVEVYRAVGPHFLRRPWTTTLPPLGATLPVTSPCLVSLRAPCLARSTPPPLARAFPLSPPRSTSPPPGFPFSLRMSWSSDDSGDSNDEHTFDLEMMRRRQEERLKIICYRMEGSIAEMFGRVLDMEFFDSDRK